MIAVDSNEAKIEEDHNTKEAEKKMPFEYDPKQIPIDPGCYLFYDKDDEIVYVGKAKNLRKRVTSYFRKNDKSPKTESLVKKICRINTRTVSSEMEALILENSLIKQHRPKYNILLRDDKNFLYLRITNESLPKLELTRRLLRDGASYIGPRTSSKSFRKTISFCQKFFGAKMVNTSQDNYVSRLRGKKTSDEEYRQNIKRMKKFLRGDTKEVIAEIKERMMYFAKERNFEAAAKMRDLLTSIAGSTKRQTIEFSGDYTPRDFIHFHRNKNKVFFVRMVFRNGKFVDLNEIKFRATEFESDADLVGQFLLQFYTRVDMLPKEIFVPALPDDVETVIDFLTKQRDETADQPEIELENSDKKKPTPLKITIHVPERGDKVKVLNIAAINAKNFAEKSHIAALSQTENFARALPELTQFLGLEQPIRRIECYDISHFAGQQTVASQVTFIDGQPYKNAYRRYKIETLKPGEIDDFASMKEVLGRRFLRLAEQHTSEQKKNKKNTELASKSEICLKKVENEDDKKAVLTFAGNIFAPMGWDMEIQDRHLDETKNSIWAAYKNNEIIGMVRAGKFVNTWWQIRSLAIIPAYQKQGLATRLIDMAKTHALEQAGKKIFVISSTAAVGFYETYGFQLNEKPIKKITAYIKEAKEKYEDNTETIWQSYEIKLEPKKSEKNIPEYPDLIVIDGGKGQLSSVLKVLDPIMKSVDFEAINWKFDISKNVIALAKREEEVFRGTVNKKEKVEFEQLDININSAASKLLQRTRDEAHRFAITFNRNLRAKSAMKSILDEIPGIGGRTKKKLLETFGSVSGIRATSDKELLEVVNQKQLLSLRKQL